ncbi:c-type cytochrome [Leptospira brenneri]|uniref:c-type cytochrome n=1 Tax=Leptospira brenneri TaxID=2023182 RepID=UPI000C2AD0EE|nr:cytochrome c [Leptospira brenneri]PJZ44213.1 hypothetical protein CH361_16340 [Leptospira brenneri]
MKPYLNQIFCVCSILIFQDCSYFQPILAKIGIRENPTGIYTSGTIANSNIYLRFYKDGLVLSKITDETIDNTSTNLSLQNTSDPQLAFGEYKVSGTTIQFSTKDVDGEYHFKGNILNKDLIELDVVHWQFNLPPQIMFSKGNKLLDPNELSYPEKSIPNMNENLMFFKGKRLLKMRACTACHAIESSEKIVGPSLQGIYNKVRNLTNGKKILADETYLRNSILNPNLEIVEGYPPAMPSFEGSFTDDELSQIILTLKKL